MAETAAQPRLRLGGIEKLELGLQSDLRADAGESKKADSALIFASRAASSELREFAFSVPPSAGSLRARLMLTQVMFLRTLLMMLPCGGCGRVALRSDGKENGFLMSLLRLGGIEKAYTLLVVARFDRDQNDIIDDEERREYEKQGERLVTNAIAGCQNTAVVAALLVAAAHLTSIGRPIAFSASPDFMELYGQPAADVVLSLTYFFNVLVEVGALLQLGYWP